MSVSPSPAAASLRDAAPRVHWLDDPTRPSGLPRLSGLEQADLVVVGGGYTGLWAALRAKEREPGTDVVLVEAGHCGDQASGRNGGFASASLTHGFANGLERWPEELATLDRLGSANLHEIAATVRRHGIDCGWEGTGARRWDPGHHQPRITTLAPAAPSPDLVLHARDARAASRDRAERDRTLQPRLSRRAR